MIKVKCNGHAFSYHALKMYRRNPRKRSILAVIRSCWKCGTFWGKENGMNWEPLVTTYVVEAGKLYMETK